MPFMESYDLPRSPRRRTKRRVKRTMRPDGMSMSMGGDIIKIDDDERLVFGWAQVTHDAEGAVAAGYKDLTITQ